MVESTNKNTGLKVTIVILAILVLGLSGFIAYDKVLKDIINPVKEDSNKIKITNDEKENIISEEEALKIGNELWNYAYGTMWNDNDIWEKHIGEDGRSIVCGKSIEQVKSRFTTNYKIQGRDLGDGSPDLEIPDCNSGNRGAIQTYIDTTLAVSNIADDEIKYNATSTYTYNESTSKDFIIKKVNNEWLISYFYLPN